MEIRTIPVGQLEANCYLVIDEPTREAVVIDPGDDAGLICREIEDAGANPRHILLTHGHPDHAFAVGELQERFPEADLLMHEADLPQLEGEPDLIHLFYDVSTYVSPKLGPCLNDGDVLRIGSTELNVLHTPGHSAGGLCFVSQGHAFTGDTLFAGSIGRTDFAGGSHEELMRSITEKLLTLPPETIIHPGHGPTSTIGVERETNPWIRE